MGAAHTFSRSPILVRACATHSAPFEKHEQQPNSSQTEPNRAGARAYTTMSLGRCRWYYGYAIPENFLSLLGERVTYLAIAKARRSRCAWHQQDQQSNSRKRIYDHVSSLQTSIQPIAYTCFVHIVYTSDYSFRCRSVGGGGGVGALDIYEFVWRHLKISTNQNDFLIFQLWHC